MEHLLWQFCMLIEKVKIKGFDSYHSIKHFEIFLKFNLMNYYILRLSIFDLSLTTKIMKR